jgi:ABC-type transport system involved in multi-copper enzyme maturation permease subunit
VTAPETPRALQAPRRRLAGVGALLKKEWLAEQRGMQVPIIVSLFVGALVLLDLLIIGFSIAEKTTPSWETGYYVFRIVGVLIGFGLGIVLPIISATAITGEREKRTWDLLCSTGLSLGRIILGKHASSSAMAFFMLLTALPCFALVVILGGVRPDQFLIGLFLMMLAVSFWSAVGIWVSTQFKRSLGSIATMIGLILAAHTAPLIFVVSTGLNESPGPSPPQTLSAFFYPVLSIFIALPERTIAFPGFTMPLVAAGMLFIALATIAVLRAARAALDESDRDAGVSGRTAGLAALLLATLPYCVEVAKSGRMNDQYALFASSILPLLALLQFPMTRALASRERLAGFRGFLGALLDPRGLLRARTSSIPLFQATAGTLIALAAFGAAMAHSNPESVAHFVMLSGAAFLGGTGAAAWSTLAFGAARRFNAPRLASAIVLFLMAFVIVTSFIPGLPHFVGRDIDAPTSLSKEFQRGASPAYPVFAIVRTYNDSPSEYPPPLRSAALPPGLSIVLLVSLSWQALVVVLGILIGRDGRIGVRP